MRFYISGSNNVLGRAAGKVHKVATGSVHIKLLFSVYTLAVV